MTTLSASEARATLPHVLDLVEAGEEVTITRHGRPVARVVKSDVVRTPRNAALLDEADRIHDMLEAARERPIQRSLSIERAEELVAEIRRDRDSRD